MNLIEKILTRESNPLSFLFEEVDTNSLETEALKYNSAEEFVKSQGKQMYHGTNKEFVKFTKSGVGDLGRGHYLTPNIESAKSFAWGKSYNYGGKKIIIEVYPFVKKTLTLGNGEDGIHAQKLYNKGNQLNQTGSNIEAFAKKRGYDSIYRHGSGTEELLVFNGKNIKTKTQLIEIWNSVHESN